jgi:hypothetical protein
MPEDERERQLKALREAVDRKAAAADEASRQQHEDGTAAAEISGDQSDLTAPGRMQDVRDVRKKNTGHGHKTADKWNQ